MAQLLPPLEEREWILDALARLGRQTGWDPLICAPLLLPEPRFFPDLWTPDGDGVRRLARRLQLYAGLEGLGTAVELFEEAREQAPAGVMASSIQHQGAAAYFAGIVEGVSLFGVDIEQLGDALGVTATIAHEVAHAFRTHHRIALADPEQIDEEERLTDLTTIYLGAGVLTTNATARHRSEQRDGLFGHQWSFRSLGYLSPEAMSFALAVIVVARGLDRAERRKLAAALELNQAASFKQAVAWLEREQPQLRTRLGLPEDPADWPSPWSLDELTAPLDEPPAIDSIEDDEDEPEPEPPPWNTGRPIFRVRPGYERGDRVLASFIALALGFLASRLDLRLGGVVGLFGFWAARDLIRQFGADRCSDPECDQRIPKGAVSCPNCGGSVAGEIRARNERLAAEEQLAGREARLNEHQ
jgi:hypothetical protein